MSSSASAVPSGMRTNSSYSVRAVLSCRNLSSTKYVRVTVSATPVATTTAMGTTLASPQRRPLPRSSLRKPMSPQPAPLRWTRRTARPAAARLTGTYQGAGTTRTMR